MSQRLVDLSHPIESGMTTYPGLPAPVVSDFLAREGSAARYGGKAEFQISRIEMIVNTGTYLDAPSHRYAEGGDIASLPLERLANLPGLLVRAGDDRRIDAARLAGHELAGRAVLLATGWSRHWRTESYGSPGHPFVTRDAAELIARSGAALVGIDSVNIDDIADLSRPAHTILLGAGIPVVEHLTNLETLEHLAFTFFAVPAPVQGVGTWPVRAFAIASC